MEMPLVATCFFGLERILKFELTRIGAKEISAEDGRVFFQGDAAVLLRANLYLTVAERVFVLLGRFKATDFESLFNGVENAPLERYIRMTDAFPVKGSSLSSKLSSVPACQSIVKKAAAKRLGEVYGTKWLPETGVKCQLQFNILRDDCLFLLDTSGAPLYKRGYRVESNLAPIRETLAAGIADLGGVRADSKVFDPMCGSGTLLIEAGLRAKGIAVGANRHFACEEYSFVPKAVIAEERQKAKAACRPSTFTAYGTDIDPKAVEIARNNVRRAGLSDCIRLEVASAKEMQASDGILLCNPPYGDRLSDLEGSRKATAEIGEVFANAQNLGGAIITPSEELEELVGRKADKKRKLYNGMKPCTVYLFNK